MKGLGPEKPASAAGGCYAYLASELVTFVRLAFADALYQRFMNAVDLLLVMPLLLEDASCGLQQGFQFIVRMRQGPFDIPKHSPQIGLELAGAPLGSFHLLRMRIPTLLAEQVLGGAVVVLSKTDASLLGTVY